MRVPGVVVGLLMAAVPLAIHAGVKVTAKHDPLFPFGAVRSWSWHPDGPGVFRMKVTANDDVEPVRARFAPILEQAIVDELSRRGWQQTTSQQPDQPDVYVTYYALISIGMPAQVMGQFVPAVAQWGLPPFPPATTALRVIEQGSLVIDLMSPDDKATVWRAVAHAELDRERADAERDRRLRAAVRDIFRKYPDQRK